MSLHCLPVLKTRADSERLPPRQPASGKRICKLCPTELRQQRSCRGAHQSATAVFGPRIHPLFHLSPSASRIKLSVIRSSLLRTLHARPSPIVCFLFVWRPPTRGQLSLRLLLFRQHPDHECDQLLKRLEMLGLV
jgi:hypothetical protein